MDNTTINVTDASAPITIEAGGFRVYGNKVASLAIAKYEGASDLFVQPSFNYFTLNINTTKVQVFHHGTVEVLMRVIPGTPFAINDLSKGLYI
jgi:hypothetical protein